METTLDLPATALDESERSFVDKVRQHGWFCTGVLEEPRKPGFSYSTGFWNNTDQPEAIVFGLTHEVAHQVLWGVFRNFQSGQYLPIGMPTDTIFGGSIAYVFPVAKRHFPNYLRWSRWFYMARDYSTPFTLASHIVHARTDAAAFRGESLRDARVAKVAACVTLEEDPGMTTALPGARLTEVTVVLRDGQARRGLADGSPGDPGWPLPNAVLRDKFLHCGQDLWGGTAAAVWDACIGLDDRRIRDVASILRSPRSPPLEET